MGSRGIQFSATIVVQLVHHVINIRNDMHNMGLWLCDEERGNRGQTPATFIRMCMYHQPFVRLTSDAWTATTRIVRPVAEAVSKKRFFDSQVRRLEGILERERVLYSLIAKLHLPP